MGVDTRLANESRGECLTAQQGTVYFIRPGIADTVKIGWTSDLPGRLRHLQGANHAKLRVIATMPGTRADEYALHQRFKALRLRREWFKLTDELRSFINDVSIGKARLFLRSWSDGPDPTEADVRAAMIASEVAA